MNSRTLADLSAEPDYPAIEAICQPGVDTAMIQTVDGGEWIESDAVLDLEDMR